MTTKEIADFCEVSTRTVRRWITKLPAEKDRIMTAGEHGETIEWDIESVYSILKEGGRGAIADWMKANKNVTPPPDKMSPPQSAESIDNAFKLAIVTLTNLAQNLDARVSKIESKIEQRQALLPAPAIKPRDHVNMLIREYASKSKEAHHEVWGMLYRQFGYRTNTSPVQCAKNRGMPIIDYIETEGMIETLEAIAMEVLV